MSLVSVHQQSPGDVQSPHVDTHGAKTVCLSLLLSQLQPQRQLAETHADVFEWGTACHEVTSECGLHIPRSLLLYQSEHHLEKNQQQQQHRRTAEHLLTSQEVNCPASVDRTEKQCHLCSYRTPYTGTLNRHMLTHTGEKPHACLYCTRCFSLKAHLRSHLRTHTGEKPFNCTYCYRGFCRKDSLQHHLQMAHAVQY